MLLPVEYHDQFYLFCQHSNYKWKMTIAVIQFVQHLGVTTLSWTLRKLILLCQPIIQMSNKILTDIMSCYIPALISHKIFMKETTKTWNWENCTDTIFFLLWTGKRPPLLDFRGGTLSSSLLKNQCSGSLGTTRQ